MVAGGKNFFSYHGFKSVCSITTNFAEIHVPNVYQTNNREDANRYLIKFEVRGLI